MRWRLRRFAKILIQPLLLLSIVYFFIVVRHNITVSKANDIMSIFHSKSPSFLLVSVCSKQADKRGPFQKVFSYSIYGNFSNPDLVNRYVKPLSKTVNQMSAIYPGMNTLQY